VSRRLRLHWEILAEVENFPDHTPNGLLLVVRVQKSRWARCAAWWLRLRARRNPRAVLRRDARRYVV
jgi:hypothetical protein